MLKPIEMESVLCEAFFQPQPTLIGIRENSAYEVNSQPIINNITDPLSN